MYLVNQSVRALNATYLSVADFKAMGNDNAELLARYDDATLLRKLIAASGAANAIMRRNLLARERIEFFTGDGGPSLALGASPVLYVRQMQVVDPSSVGYALPTSSLLLDALAGELVTYAPLALTGVGYVAGFPRGLTFAVTFASGYGYNPARPPAWTSADAPGSIAGLVPGAPYTLGVTTRTPWGETLPTVRTVSTGTGALTAMVTPVLGACKYRVFLAAGATATTQGDAAAGAAALTFSAPPGYAVGSRITVDPMGPSAETVTITGGSGATRTITPLAGAHAAGTLACPELALVGEMPSVLCAPGQIFATIASANPPADTYPEVAPLVDSSALSVPENIAEAVALLLLSGIYERNNLANRGVAATESGRKSTSWRSTEGSSGRGVPTMWSQAEQLLQPHRLSALFGK